MINNIYNKIFRFFVPAKTSAEIRHKYNIPSNLSIKISIKDGSFVLTCDELPGLITEASDVKKLIHMFNDAVLSYFDVPRLEGDVVYEKMNIDGYGTFFIENEKKVTQLA